MSLCRMARVAGMALWADLHERGIDLWAVLDGEGRHSAAEAWAVAEALPDNTRTAAALAGDPDAHGWGIDRELFVVLLNALRGEKDKPFVSPLAEAQKKKQRAEMRERMNDPAEIMAMFGALGM